MSTSTSNLTMQERGEDSWLRGYTADGVPVFRDLRGLSFHLMSISSWTRPMMFWLEFYWNKTTGRGRRPYVSVAFGPVRFKSGWLF